MKPLVFVPIKEKSQRVPNKNFRVFDGEPLYRRCLLKLKDFDVHVDTDSEKLKRLIEGDEELSHVKVHTRPDSLRGHNVSVCDLMKDWILRVEIEPGRTICQVHVTSPFLDSETLKDAYQHLIDPTYPADGLWSSTEHQARLWREEEYGFCPVNHNPMKLEQTQDLPVFEEENSLFYFFKAGDLLRTGQRINTNSRPWCTSFLESLDIDTEEDWALCEIIARGLKK